LSLFDRKKVKILKCPYCIHSETKVLDSRESSNQESTRRRRECEKCSKRFTTYERIELLELGVIKKDGRREPFSREKLIKGMLRACEKRPVATEQITLAVDEIEGALRKRDETEIHSAIVGELVMDKLKQLDAVAYIRFASVYRQFKDVAEFAKEIARLRTEKTSEILTLENIKEVE
jgi:transcriptional repressor NrdR